MSKSEDLRKAIVKIAIENVKIDKPKWKPKDPFLRDMNYWIEGILTISEVSENVYDRLTLEQVRWRNQNKRKTATIPK